ncbi:uncharacterized protein A4U43_C02F1170 [Asparagus officinalis]|uniref:S-acyltransferase n=1 Tax=Asparagus officinalis TaxID=4686 RepID=A0A5P1FJR7_ASPOF|nr:uncharacterized protein A4U43_C02F1170 [Asparagus officinalis]
MLARAEDRRRGWRKRRGVHAVAGGVPWRRMGLRWSGILGAFRARSCRISRILRVQCMRSRGRNYFENVRQSTLAVTRSTGAASSSLTFPCIHPNDETHHDHVQESICQPGQCTYRYHVSDQFPSTAVDKDDDFGIMIGSINGSVVIMEFVTLELGVGVEGRGCWRGGDLRYCQKCSHYKPPRAHHCRVCKRCVLRMDHHCVWINNCVGHANYKVFLVFVLYAVIACIHSMVLLFGSVVHDMHKDQQQNGGSFRTSYIICGVLLIPLTLALSVLLGWHIYLILHNKTTIEYHEGVRAMWLAEKVGNIYRHPYDLGVYDNLVSVLGPNIFCWLCPITRHNGSGVRFRTSYDLTFPATPR